MFDIEAAITRTARIPRRDLPLCNFVAAFPKTSESDWSSHGFDKTMPMVQLLFKEHIEEPRRLKQRISMLVRESLAETRKEQPLTAEQVTDIRKAFGDSAVINEERPPRAWVEERKLGAYVDEMVALDKYLSAEQQELSRLNIEGHPRLIRGVAGSGKTVVLANLVARFINRRASQADDMFEGPADKPRVAVVCFNRALVQFIQQKVRDSYKQQTLQSLDSDAAVITNYNGLFWHLVKKECAPLQYIRVQDVEDSVQRAAMYCEQLREMASQNPEWHSALLYDAIFVDEGQDFEAEEYRLLLDMIRPDPRTGEKTLVIFYDDAQNLYGHPRPNWSQIGIDVQRGDRARVMRECFRNTREIVELAFNVLLGTQAPQYMRVQTRTYADINYLKRRGLVEEVGDHIRVRFAERSGQKPTIRKFRTRGQEKQWLAEEIVRLVDEEEVRPEDILVLFHRKADFENLTDLIAAKSNTVQGFVQPYDRRPDVDSYIFRRGFLTVSTTHGAKGYDAPIVFLVGADLFDLENAGRASFYVGATRSKLLLYVTGLESGESLLREAEAVNAVL